MTQSHSGPTPRLSVRMARAIVERAGVELQRTKAGGGAGGPWWKNKGSLKAGRSTGGAPQRGRSSGEVLTGHVQGGAETTLSAQRRRRSWLMTRL